MKTFKNYLLFITLVIVSFTSCKKKDEFVPTKTTVIENEPNFSPIGYTWELVDAKLFVTKNNGTTGSIISKTYYNHFGSTNTSNLDAFVLSTLPIDNITKGVTTWQMSNSGIFTLNSTTQYNYDYTQATGLNPTLKVMGLENGSSRPIEVIKCTDNYLHVKIYESQSSDSNYDYFFYSVLEFVKVGGSGNNVPHSVSPEFTYGGVWSTPTTTNPNNMTGQKWVVTKYQNTSTNQTINVNDTLEFVSTTQYKISGVNGLRNYSISNIVGNNMKNLNLYSFTTLGGDWGGQVQSTFMTDGVVNNATFQDLFGVSPNVRLWMTRIQ